MTQNRPGPSEPRQEATTAAPTVPPLTAVRGQATGAEVRAGFRAIATVLGDAVARRHLSGAAPPPPSANGSPMRRLTAPGAASLITREDLATWFG